MSTEGKGIIQGRYPYYKNINLSGLVLNCLELECLTSNLENTYGALFYDNTSVVWWKIKIRLGSSLEAGSLLHFLGMHIHKM